MAGKTKADLAYEILTLKAKLADSEKMVAVLEAANKAADRSVICYDNRKWVAVPLTYQEDNAAREAIEDYVARQCEGYGPFSLTVEPFRGELLPNYSLFQVTGYCDNETGSHVDRIYGLVVLDRSVQPVQFRYDD